MKVIIAIFLTLMLTGCYWGNLRHFEKENISASGFNYLGWGAYNYYMLTIDYPTDKSASVYNFALELPNGLIIKSTEFTFENIKNIPDIAMYKMDDSKDGKTQVERYGLSYGHNLDNGDVYFYFEEKKLTTILLFCKYPVADEKDLTIRIGKLNDAKMYKFPLDECQLRDVFGEADNIRTSWLMP